MDGHLHIDVFDVTLPECAATEGPCPDADLVVWLQELGRLHRENAGRVRVRWHVTGKDPETCARFPAIAALLRERGGAVLPVVLVNGRVAKTGAFPCCAELERIAAEDLVLASQAAG